MGAGPRTSAPKSPRSFCPCCRGRPGSQDWTPPALNVKQCARVAASSGRSPGQPRQAERGFLTGIHDARNPPKLQAWWHPQGSNVLPASSVGVTLGSNLQVCAGCACLPACHSCPHHSGHGVSGRRQPPTPPHPAPPGYLVSSCRQGTPVRVTG